MTWYLLLVGIAGATAALTYTLRSSGASISWLGGMMLFYLGQRVLAGGDHALLYDGADTCGVNFYGDSPHFGGNFWWARCDYIRALPPPTPRCWTCGELWLNSLQQPAPATRVAGSGTAAAGTGTDELGLGSAASGAVAEPEFTRVKNLCDSNVDHYLEPFPREKWPDVAEVESRISMRWRPGSASAC